MGSNNSRQTAKKPGKIKVLHWQKVMIFLIFYDIAAVSFSYFVALVLRFDLRFSQIPATYLNPWMKFAPIYAVICLLIFWFFRLYQSIWQFASTTEFIRITEASVASSILHIILITILFQRMPISYYIMGAGIQFLLLLVIRFAYRFLLMIRAERNKSDVSRVMLIGAGSAGQTILRDIRAAKEVNEKVVCFIDDNSNKWGRDIEGIRCVGGRDSIIENVEKYKIDKIYIALPSASAKSRKNVIDICRQTDCEIKNLPGIYQLVLGEVSVSQMRKINVEDLLGREPVQMGTKEVTDFLRGKTVLVTGGGGSIGSELCRQVAAVPSVKKLIIFDIYENNAHAIKLELHDKYPDLDLVVLIGSVRDSRKIKEVFRDYRPDIVFHAAAHKHVPLMEDSPCEAIKNNAIGTYYTAFAAMAYNCEKFVMISTDKAVNPVNIMGASKRICEMIVQTFARKIAAGKASELPDLNAHTGALRSGEDRIPRFTEQIAAGGPVTVTHPDIIRYFMTIPEAASLVLTAATFGGGGKIFVLDMGTPVKIADLAKDMIRLAGLKPNEDIKIVYTGLRPGEKLYEERLMDEEGLQKTSNELINIGSPIAFDEDKFIVQLRGLMEAAYEDRENIRELVAEVVPTYHPAGRHGTEEKGEAYRQQRAEMYASAHKGDKTDGPQE